jgi:murein DD-endopeptidase MepM/ murein hydrolase activator NlpD
VLVRKGKLLPIQIRPSAAGLILCATMVMIAGFTAAVGYVVYRDDLLGSTFARQVRMQYEYEDRIAALRSELDRVTSRHVIETQGVEEQLATLLGRQDTIEQRQATLDGLVDKARGQKIAIAAAALPVPTPTAAVPATRMAEPGALAYVPAERSTAEIITGSILGPDGAVGGLHNGDPKPLISQVARSLEAVEGYQTDALDALTRAAGAEADRLSAALAPIGIAVEPTATEEPQGGPFIAAPALHFVERAAVLSRTLDDIGQLRRTADALPLVRPIAGSRVSSRFGYRNDPFLNRPALHAGLDFVAATGAEVRATASGTVIFAGWQGGYGQMVEIRHVSGVSTRYGHLSAVLVRKGQQVGRGALIGRVGSTGRSTGPHLHYETRRKGQPVDPAIFLSAGMAL